MSIAVWPAVSPDELRLKAAATQERELEWIVEETLEICRNLKHNLDDCYALLAPIDPGSTLVMSTPRNEKVKGTLTRVGTRIVKGSLHLQLRTMPAHTLSLSHSNAIHIHALDSLHTHLTQAIDLLSITLSKSQDPSSLASTLALLADSLTDSAALLKGPPLTEADPGWQAASCPAYHFQPAPGPNLSFYIGLQESSIVLWLRALEPVDAPVHFGTKLGLAIGTFRRLEHDEMDTIFKYNTKGSDSGESRPRSARHTPEPRSTPPLFGNGRDIQEVYVREKVRVESADPSLISLQSKLGFLSHMLGQARRNLSAVMGVDSED
ncbi:RAVE subunit 2/Rogdi [Ilyonectria sp. MPI-CAGE-AT-0026]|nr:RAVE subunit 2/Rogdi [Ilyonectria sp. MPI-CAGE-AT-0026]